MNKIRTAEQLFDIVAEDLIWRKRELSYMKSLIEHRGSSASHTDSLIRGGVTLLYAHWEGFVKESATAYLRFVATQRLSYAELKSNFIALAMKKMLNEAKDTNKSLIYNDVCTFFLSRLSERSDIPWEDTINTKGNLSSDILRDIVCILDFEFRDYEIKSKIIDEQLLKIRNTVAHGRYLPIDKDEFLTLHDEIIPLMDLFFNQVTNAAINEDYKS
jgi:MAE_28990/MAE_18760-like HEPN